MKFNLFGTYIWGVNGMIPLITLSFFLSYMSFTAINLLHNQSFITLFNSSADDCLHTQAHSWGRKSL